MFVDDMMPFCLVSHQTQTPNAQRNSFRSVNFVWRGGRIEKDDDFVNTNSENYHSIQLIYRDIT